MSTIWILGLHGVLAGLLIAPITFPRLESKSQCLKGVRLDVPTDVLFIGRKKSPQTRRQLEPVAMTRLAADLKAVWFGGSLLFPGSNPGLAAASIYRVRPVCQSEITTFP